MNSKEAIEFGKEQLEIFGDSRMSEFIRLAIKALENNIIDTRENPCEGCKHDTKGVYDEPCKRCKRIHPSGDKDCFEEYPY